jgi:hypothetical protein
MRIENIFPFFITKTGTTDMPIVVCFSYRCNGKKTKPFYQPWFRSRTNITSIKFPNGMRVQVVRRNYAPIYKQMPGTKKISDSGL